MAKFSLKRAGKEVWDNVTTPKRAALVLIALVLSIIGIVGTFIPFIPARIISAPALLILSVYSPTVYRSLIRRIQKYPRIQSGFDRMRNWFIHLIH